MTWMTLYDAVVLGVARTGHGEGRIWDALLDALRNDNILGRAGIMEIRKLGGDRSSRLVEQKANVAFDGKAWQLMSSIDWRNGTATTVSLPKNMKIDYERLALARKHVESFFHQPGATAERGVLPDARYLSPFMQIMLGAVEKFAITEQPNRQLKKEELVAYFRSQSLPDGTSISDNHAKAMATFVRPPEAMKGGQKRVG